MTGFAYSCFVVGTDDGLAFGTVFARSTTSGPHHVNIRDFSAFGTDTADKSFLADNIVFPVVPISARVFLW